MKKLLFAAMILAGTLPTKAETYPYLTFEMTDGAKASVAVESLTLTFSGTTLKVGSQTFPISNLSKMYFSVTDETSSVTNAISELSVDELQKNNTEIYDLNGRKMTDSQLPRGVYIVKTKDKTCKIVVR